MNKGGASLWLGAGFQGWGGGASQAQGRGPLWQEKVEGVGFWLVLRASLEGSSCALAQRSPRVVSL